MNKRNYACYCYPSLFNLSLSLSLSNELRPWFRGRNSDFVRRRWRQVHPPLSPSLPKNLLVVFSDDSKGAKIRVVREIHNSEIYLSEGRTPQLSSISEALLFDQIRQLCAWRIKFLSGAGVIREFRWRQNTNEWVERWERDEETMTG